LAAKGRFLDSKLRSLIQTTADIEFFPKVLGEAMEKRDVQKSKYNIADGMRQMFDPFERVARAHHICPCCERPFSPDEENEFVEKVSFSYTYFGVFQKWSSCMGKPWICMYYLVLIYLSLDLDPA
jgi:hypothetical protein